MNAFPANLEVPEDEGVGRKVVHSSPTPDVAQRAFLGTFFGPQESDSAEVPGVGSTITWLRRQFRDVDVGGCGKVTRTDLFQHVKLLVESTHGKLDDKLLELLGVMVRHRFGEIRLGLFHSAVGVTEWIHYMMLRGSAPSHVSAKHLNQRLRKALVADRSQLARLQAAFEAGDMQGDGHLRKQCWPWVFGMIGVTEPPKQDVAESGVLDYFEFVSFAIGVRPTMVEIAMYDLSRGAMRLLPSELLLGHRFEGIWHTGLRVFGYEYWFGGGVFEMKPGNIPFGKPVQVVRLGMTLRSREDLIEFVQNDLIPIYNKSSYDVWHHNCNCFTNELSQFLLHGQQIPEEVLMQPHWAESAGITQLLRPVLNRWLGGFGERSSTITHLRIDDMTELWRSRVRRGDMVLHRARVIDRPRVGRVISMAEADCGKKTVDLQYFLPSGERATEGIAALLSLGELWEWRLVQQPEIPLQELYPCMDEDHANRLVLDATAALESPASEVLRRTLKQEIPPICTRGHVLQEGCRTWLSRPNCSICCRPANDERSCPKCQFQVCADCLAVGASFKGGGVFADMVTPELARDLLHRYGWLRFKSSCYFNMADYRSAGVIELDEMRWLVDRLHAELGLHPLSDEDLRLEVESCRRSQMLLTPEKGQCCQIDSRVFENYFTSKMSLVAEVHASSGLHPIQPQFRLGSTGSIPLIVEDDSEMLSI